MPIFFFFSEEWRILYILLLPLLLFLSFSPSSSFAHTRLKELRKDQDCLARRLKNRKRVVRRKSMFTCYWNCLPFVWKTRTTDLKAIQRRRVKLGLVYGFAMTEEKRNWTWKCYFFTQYSRLAFLEKGRVLWRVLGIREFQARLDMKNLLVRGRAKRNWNNIENLYKMNDDMENSTCNSKYSYTKW